MATTNNVQTYTGGKPDIAQAPVMGNSGTPGNPGANLNNYSAPGSAGTQPIAATGAAGRAMNDSTGSGGTPGATPPVSPTVPNPSPTNVNATAGLPGAPTPTNPFLTSNPNDAAGAFGPNLNPPKTPSPTAAGLGNVPKNTPPPQSGSATGNTKEFMPPENNPIETPPPVQNFFDPSVNKPMDEQIKNLMEIVNPQTTRDNLASEMSKITDEKNTLATEKLQLMNVKTIMAGTEQDIRDEITKANGFASNSQVLALTVARNATLLKDAQFLQDQVTAQQDMIANDTSMLASDKATAAQESTQRMGLLNYIQTNQTNQLNAYKDNIKTMINTPGGLTALAADPTHAAQAEQIMGYTHGTIASMAKAQATTNTLDTNIKKAQLNKINSDAAAIKASDAAVNPDVLNGMLNVYKSTGVLPTFGNSAKSPLRAQFYAALGGQDGNQIVTDANTNKTVRAGLTTAYKTQQNQYAANQTANATLDKQLTLAQSFADKVNNGNSPLINKYKNALSTGIFGDPDTAALNNIVKTASYEFAKILSGAAASISGVTVNSQADAEQMLNSAMSKGQFSTVLDLMKQEANFRLNSQKDTLDQLEHDMNNVNNLTNSLKDSANTASQGIDMKSTTFTGLTATGPWGTLTFPTPEALNSFKKDHQ